MGFDNHLLNKKLLDKYNDNMEKVIEDLLISNDNKCIPTKSINLIDGK
jgi:hypothetical protein